MKVQFAQVRTPVVTSRGSGHCEGARVRTMQLVFREGHYPVPALVHYWSTESQTNMLAASESSPTCGGLIAMLSTRSGSYLDTFTTLPNVDC